MVINTAGHVDRANSPKGAHSDATGRMARDAGTNRLRQQHKGRLRRSSTSRN